MTRDTCPRAPVLPSPRSFSCLRPLWLGGCVAVLLLWAAWVRADPAAPTAQRQAFRVADAALSRGERIAYDHLRGYPLYPYLVYRDLRGRLATLPVREVRAFLAAYPDTPLAARLRGAWLRELAKAQRWSDYLLDHRPSEDVELECGRRRALLETGRREAALEGIETVWMTGRSLPDACNPVFALWRDRGGITRERLWERFELALQAGQSSLAGYLRQQLPSGDRPLADRWLAIDEDPRRVLDDPPLPAASRLTPKILLHGVDRWARRDSVEATAALDRLLRRYEFPPEQLGPVQRRLALYLAARRDPQALERLTALPVTMVDDQVREWRVRLHLGGPDWSGVLRWLDGLTAEERGHPRWRYWQARALEATGQRERAAPIYRRLAGERDYHGFLAADRLNLPYAFQDRPLRLTDEEVAAFVQRSAALQRAYELLALDREPEAREEWRLATASFDAAQAKTAAAVADAWRWPSEAVRTITRAGELDALGLRFPRPHAAELEKSAAAAGIDPAWAFAVMRQESLFQADIRSSAAAVGLMQLLPETAARVARRLGSSPPGSAGLTVPSTNIRLGTAYLREVRDDLQDSTLLATAAYNAGPHRVRQWLPTGSSVDADRWAETIPFSETRAYVQRVLEYAIVYARDRKGGHGLLRTWMPPVRPG